MKTKTESISIRGRHIARITRERSSTGEFDWNSGEVVTPHGIVTILAQGDPQNFHHTRWDFAHRGRLYMRTINKRISPRGIARVAKHADFSQCPPHLEDDVDRLLRGEGGPSS